MAPPLSKSKKNECDKFCNPIVLPVMHSNEAPEAKLTEFGGQGFWCLTSPQNLNKPRASISLQNDFPCFI